MNPVHDVIDRKVDEIRVNTVHLNWVFDSDLRSEQLHLVRSNGYGLSVVNLSSVTYSKIKIFIILAID